MIAVIIVVIVIVVILIRKYLGIENGLRFSTEIYWRNRLSVKAYRKLVLFLHKFPKVSGNLREFMG